jgi:hypothetical protein
VQCSAVQEELVVVVVVVVVSDEERRRAGVTKEGDKPTDDKGNEKGK